MSERNTTIEEKVARQLTKDGNKAKMNYAVIFWE